MSNCSKSKAAKDSVAPFLLKTYDMLNDEANHHIIAWTAEGNSFRIYDDKLLVEKLLPQYFKHNNLNSFVRQLHTYGFRKVARDPNTLEFKNSKFIRGERNLLKEIKRRTSVKRRAVDVVEEEDSEKEAVEPKVKRIRTNEKQCHIEKRLKKLEKLQRETQDLMMTQIQHMNCLRRDVLSLRRIIERQVVPD